MKSKKENGVEYCALFNGLVDLVEHQGKPVFLVKDRDDLIFLEEKLIDGTPCVPPPTKLIPWLLPNGERIKEIYQTSLKDPEMADKELYGKLIEYHKDVSELPTQEHYDLIAAWVLHTYLLETIQYTPFIWFYAIPERGKSRTGKGMIHAAYRGIHVESLSEAFIFRLSENFRASIFFDVNDIMKKMERKGSEDILLCRFEKGAKVPKVLYMDRGKFEDTAYFNIFGPTIIATNQGISGPLESRTIQINMPASDRSFETTVTPESCLWLKEQLLAFRARHLNQKLPDVPVPIGGRLKDILRPLFQVLYLIDSDNIHKFHRLVQRLVSERAAEKSQSLEAQVILAVASNEGRAVGGTLDVATITERVNRDKPDRYRHSPSRIGMVLKSLGFVRTRTGNDGRSSIFLNEALIETLKDSFGLTQLDGQEKGGGSFKKLYK